MFISIEGVEGSGKSTLINAIKDYGQQHNIDICFTREPGGTEIAEVIRETLLNDYRETLHAHTELLLMFASRVQHVHEVIIPALNNGRWVVSDRFLDASYAYQGGGRQVDFSMIDNLSQTFIPDAALPNYVLLMDAPLDICLQRVQNRGGLDRIEKESRDFFQRVYQAYQKRKLDEPNRFIVLDATWTPAALNEKVKEILCQIKSMSGTLG